MNSSYGKIYGRPELGREEVGGLKPAALVWETITIFRVLRLIKKVHLIRLHATLHVCLIAFAIGGFVTSFDLHYATGLPHLRNMHGLMGMITMIFFCMQK
uniref:Cytochrome b561 domain-containing protein n=1 Tax=Rhodnius prolixus TaxID=13249 RepID=T1I6U8_RHOPR